MSHENLSHLLDRWNSDPLFRAEVRRAPLQAIAAAGMTLTAAEQASVLAIDWSLSDQELAGRADAFII